MGDKRKLKRVEKGPGKKDYSTLKSASKRMRKVSEEISIVIDRSLLYYTNSNNVK